VFFYYRRKKDRFGNAQKNQFKILIFPESEIIRF